MDEEAMNFNRLFLLVVLILGLSFAGGCRVQNEGLVISGIWARPSPMSAGNGAVYMWIENNNAESERLVSVSSEIANAVELHLSKNQDGVMSMMQVEHIDIPAVGSVALEPGGYHVMLIGLKEEFKAGDVFEISLEFSSGQIITVEVVVKE
ncbi:copper chaperone PCu(A)C [Chloroflexota bacterium]